MLEGDVAEIKATLQRLEKALVKDTDDGSNGGEVELEQAYVEMDLNGYNHCVQRMGSVGAFRGTVLSAVFAAWQRCKELAP